MNNIDIDLFIALESSKAEGLSEIIENGLDLNVIYGHRGILPSGHTAHYGNKTLLSSAVGGNCIEIVKLLLDKGADPNSLCGKPLFIAAGRGCNKIVEMLLKYGAKVNPDDPKGERLLESAATSGRTGAVKLLLDMGVNIDAKDKWGKAALSYARVDVRKIKLLLDRGTSHAMEQRQFELIASRLFNSITDTSIGLVPESIEEALMIKEVREKMINI